MRATFPVCDYHLPATLSCGQAFGWRERAGAWEGVVARRWVRLQQREGGEIVATAAVPQADWQWLADYLQTGLDLDAVVASFPNDAPMRAALAHAKGLRLLRQDPWECLAAFICSSTKQIVQIQQILAHLRQRFGDRVATPPGFEEAFSFPPPERIAAATELELRACKMGFRAPYLRETARLVSARSPDLLRLGTVTCEEARAALEALPGVGRKVADCVLLFAFGFQEAFPVDVWVMRALRELYFPRRRPSESRLRRFSQTYFGPHAGYAQQYLFHYMRTGRRAA